MGCLGGLNEKKITIVIAYTGLVDGHNQNTIGAPYFLFFFLEFR